MKNRNRKFKELTQYLEPITQVDRFGEWSGGKGNGSFENPHQWPYVDFNDVVIRFEKSVYRFEDEHPEYELNQYSVILEKNNITWDQKSMSNADADKLDSQCILALIIAAIRAERFCTGALLDFFEEGLILRWLKRLKDIDELVPVLLNDSNHDIYYDVKNIKASVGGYFGVYYDFELNFESRQLKWKHYGAGEEEQFEKRIQKKTLEKFRKGLKFVNLINWKRKYLESNICDGTQWSIEIDIDGRKKKIIGDNKFPKESSEFCQLVREVFYGT